MAQHTSQYEHFWPDVPTNPDFPDKFKFNLITSLDQLKELLKEPCDLMGFDLETTGLNPEKDDIVSFSFAFSETEGYNVPCFHDAKTNDGNPGLGEEALDLIYDYMVNKAKVVAIHNFSFECMMMEWHGFTQMHDKQKRMWMQLEGYEDEVTDNICVNADEVVLPKSGQLSIFDEPEVKPIYELVTIKTPFKKEDAGHCIKYDMSKVRYFDTMISCWLSDTNDPKVGLKKYEEKFLGWRSDSFTETLGDNVNFKFTKYTDPKIIEYTCLDAMGAVGLAKATKRFYLEAQTSGRIDMKFIYPLTRCMYNLQRFDHESLLKYDNQLQTKLDEIEKKCYELSSKKGIPEFKIKSAADRRKVFIAMGIDTGKSSARTGLMQTGKAALAGLDKDNLTKDQKDIINETQEFTATSAIKNTFVKNLLDACSNPLRPDYGRFNFRTTVVPSGRLAASGDGNGSGYVINVNIQNQPKPHPQDYHCIHIDEAPENIRKLFKNADGKYINDVVSYTHIIDYPREKEDEEPELVRTYDIVRILDYLFCPLYWLHYKYEIINEKGEKVEKSERYPDDFPFENENPEAKIVEGADQELNVRSIYLPFRDDEYLLSIDYSGQELKSAAMLSGEPVWVEAFTNRQDAHKATAMKVFCHGDPTKYDKSMRKLAKNLNFGIVYGMAAYSIWTRGYTKTLEEAEDFYDKFKQGLPTLFKWLDDNARIGKQTGTIKTLFGRPRRVKYWFNSNNRSLEAFGFRTCCNDPCQGTGADITKMSIINVFNQYLDNPEWKDKIRWHSTVHDEVNYSVKKEYAAQLSKEINKLMTVYVAGKSFPFDTGLSLGLRWGQLFDFDYDKDTFDLLHPKWDDLGEKPADFDQFKILPKETVLEMLDRKKKENPNELYGEIGNYDAREK